jgi:hypothetical protein
VIRDVAADDQWVRGGRHGPADVGPLAGPQHDPQAGEPGRHADDRGRSRRRADGRGLGGLPGVLDRVIADDDFVDFQAGTADTWTTFRRVTFPAIRSSLLAGALLAFALSFDEVIVTIFTAGGVKTLPLWIFQSFRLANQVPVVNVAGVVAILLSAIPVYIATRLTSDTGAAAAR